MVVAKATPPFFQPLPTLIKHFEKLPSSALKSELGPKVEALKARALFFNRILFLFGIHTKGALKP